MRVFLTGGSGFLGRRTILLLRRHGHEVIALARSTKAMEEVSSLGADPVSGDLDDPVSLDIAFATKTTDALVNLASLGFGHAPAILAAAQKAGIHRGVFVSTTAIYTTLNAKSKMVRIAAEQTVTSSSMEWTILRPTMIYGAPGDRNMERLIRLLRRLAVVPLPSGGQRLQQPVHVDDVAQAIVLALECPDTAGRAYDIAGPEPLSLRRVVMDAAATAGRRPVLVPVPIAPAVVLARLYERLAPRPRLKAEQVERLNEDKVFNIDSARRDMNYEPRAFRTGIAEEASLLPVSQTGAARWALFLRTARHLRPVQVAHRVRLRLQRAVVTAFPRSAAYRLQVRVGTPEAAWPGHFAPIDATLGLRFPSARANDEGIFLFLNDERSLGSPPHWRPYDVPRLWVYHLHYMEWAWSFSADPDRAWARDSFARLWWSWKTSTRFGRRDEWSPYVASVRAWVLCGVFADLVKGSDMECSFVDDLALHAGYLRTHLETDVGGNHLVKNLKALFGLGVLLDDERSITTARRYLTAQLGIQVLSDGGHYERSPSYHCQVLGDLTDIACLLDASGRLGVPGLDDAIAGMRSWLGTVLMPDGDVPQFNDCSLVGRIRLHNLAPMLPKAQPLSVLLESGYVVATLGPFHLIADVGLPCPTDLPAHAHADCLSFELAVHGRRVIVDSGTSTYEAGTTRDHERSTQAHNTVSVDGRNQTEVWGVFRAGRRARPTVEMLRTCQSEIEVIASHDGFQRLHGSPVHRRTWRLETDRLVIIDDVQGAGLHHIAAALHLAPDEDVSHDSTIVRIGDHLEAHLDGPRGSAVAVEPAQISTEFGRRIQTQRLVLSVTAELPVELRTTIRLR